MHPSAHRSHSLPPRPSHAPIDLTYSTLHRSASSGHIVFRVWTSSSASTLQLCEGDMDRSGFSAPAAAYERISPRAYAAATKGLAASAPAQSAPMQHDALGSLLPKPLPLDQGHWANSASLRKKCVNHILGRTPSAVERSKKEESVWISTARNLDWAIWDVSRRLAFAHALARARADAEGSIVNIGSELQVHLSVIKIDPPARPGSGASTPEAEGMPSCVRGSGQGEGEKRRGPSEMWIRPRDVLSSALDTVDMTAVEKNECVLARNRAGLCEEVLFYGRVFGRSVLADVVFTATALPMSLPYHFYRPLSIQGNDLPGWIQRVRWNPLEEKPDWIQTKHLMKHAIYGLPTAWNRQPVRHIPTHWPNSTHRSQALSIQRSRLGMDRQQQGRRPGDGGSRIAHPLPHRPITLVNRPPPQYPVRLPPVQPPSTKYRFGPPPHLQHDHRTTGAQDFESGHSAPPHIALQPAPAPRPPAPHMGIFGQGFPLIGHSNQGNALLDPAYAHHQQYQPIPQSAKPTYNPSPVQVQPRQYSHAGAIQQYQQPPPMTHQMGHVHVPVSTYFAGPALGGTGAMSDFMGPEAWEAMQMARAEAMLIDLNLR